MSRWEKKDQMDYDFERRSEWEEESHLIKKFYDYLDLEKNEKERRKSLEKTKPNNTKNSRVHSLVLNVSGGIAITGLTFAFWFFLRTQV